MPFVGRDPRGNIQVRHGFLKVKRGTGFLPLKPLHKAKEYVNRLGGLPNLEQDAINSRPPIPSELKTNFKPIPKLREREAQRALNAIPDLGKRMALPSSGKGFISSLKIPHKKQLNNLRFEL